MNQIAQLIQNLPTNDDVLAVGICGGSGSGKSFIADKLNSVLTQAGHEVITINQDDFSIGRGFANKHISPYRWDDPENYRIDECHQVVKLLKAGGQCQFKAYNLIDHEPTTTKTLSFDDKSVKKTLILEGILAWYGPLASEIDFRLFVELGFYERFTLRLFRNIYKIKNADADTVIQQFFTHVSLAHIEIIENLKTSADHIWQQSIDLMLATEAKILNQKPSMNLRVLYSTPSLEVSVGQPDLPWLAVHIDSNLVFSQRISKENQQLMIDFSSES